MKNEMAFPLIDPTSGACATGLTIREYAAIHILSAAIIESKGVMIGRDELVESAVEYVDSLFNELNKK